jgi:hypothetical protein
MTSSTAPASSRAATAASSLRYGHKNELNFRAQTRGFSQRESGSTQAHFVFASPVTNLAIFSSPLVAGAVGRTGTAGGVAAEHKRAVPP